ADGQRRRYARLIERAAHGRVEVQRAGVARRPIERVLQRVEKDVRSGDAERAVAVTPPGTRHGNPLIVGAIGKLQRSHSDPGVVPGDDGRGRGRGETPGRAPEADRQIEDVDGVTVVAKAHGAGQPSVAVLLLGDIKIESETV